MEEVKPNPLNIWKMTPFDEPSKALWAEYKDYKEKMINHSNSDYAPWIEINKERREEEMIAAARQLLQLIP